MQIDPDEAQDLLRHIDPGRICCRRPLGLRDGALLALFAAGLTSAEIVALKATAVTDAGKRIVITFRRKNRRHLIVLKPDHAARLVAWLTERRLWRTPEPVFTAFRGRPLSERGARAIVERYRSNHRRSPR